MIHKDLKAKNKIVKIYFENWGLKHLRNTGKKGTLRWANFYVYVGLFLIIISSVLIGLRLTNCLPNLIPIRLWPFINLGSILLAVFSIWKGDRLRKNAIKMLDFQSEHIHNSDLSQRMQIFNKKVMANILNAVDMDSKEQIGQLKADIKEEIDRYDRTFTQFAVPLSVVIPLYVFFLTTSKSETELYIKDYSLFSVGTIFFIIVWLSFEFHMRDTFLPILFRRSRALKEVYDRLSDLYLEKLKH